MVLLLVAGLKLCSKRCRFDFKYSSITADIDEKAIRRAKPRELVRVLAHAKAKAIIAKLKANGSLVSPGFLVTFDQVLYVASWHGEKTLNSPSYTCAPYRPVIFGIH